MKLSKLMHIGSVAAGLTGVVTFVFTIIGSADNLVFGITKVDALLCSGILLLIAIWLAIGTIHHIILERHGEIL
ncbi:MAG: hypothetical protein A2735_01780 [Candidatus Yanofskybacteria bacterium RIFCSPHIGHO2_01_FULL_41_21]|uniref:Uncharacterized protein n=1 Tax=Candidatus Yanofskybacteria bacterium RIFCSPHIGHO2_01_FULL_41_21 TaxID=1802660 RepID=A0A1F8E9F2_9BACT|nr:MAG: hypothetical protein A2735_01780 [Candidatus Yanofskybacteria bacterium RIFCSPHIGHO2_01_FULL_41_21]